MTALSGDKAVTSELAARLDAVRGQVQAAIDAARGEAASRFARARVSSSSQGRIETLLAASRRRVDALLDARGDSRRDAADTPPIADLHAVEEMLSHVRHSVVRVCFYNLKLFCPSLVDEFDAQVEENVRANLRQLDAVAAELRAFFAQRLSDKRTLAAHFPEAESETRRHLAALADAGARLERQFSAEAARREFAKAAPGHIDAFMAALGQIQTHLDAQKIALADIVREAVELAAAETRAAGVEVEIQAGACPRVFGDARRLLNACLELLHNAARHSRARTLRIGISPTPDRLWVEARFEDDGHGMPRELLETCLARGVTTGGSGEGLAMVVAVVEAGHLGCFTIDAAEGAGCRAVLRLPVKLQLAGRRDGSQA